MVIEYDYCLVRDEVDEKHTYVPDQIPKSLPRLVLIEGPNSCGKTTLLNIVALGFHGLKQDKLDPALKAALRNLVDADHQSLKFSVRIRQEDGSLLLISSKDDAQKQDVVVREIAEGKERILAPELFHRKYNLIYDIPDNPKERLKHLISEIRDLQTRYAARVGALRSTVYRLINEVKQSRDPRQLEQLASMIKKNEGQMNELRDRRSRTEALLEMLEKYRFSRAFVESRKRFERVDTKLDILRRERETAEKQEKKANTKLRQKHRETSAKIEELKGTHRELLSILQSILGKDASDRLEVWERIDFEVVLRDGKFPESLSVLMRHFRGALQKLVDKDRQKMTEAKVYADLIDVLKNYRHANIVIPGLDKPIEDFIDILEHSAKGSERTRILLERIDSAFHLLDKIEEDRRAALQLASDLRLLKSTNGESDEDFAEGDELETHIITLDEDLGKALEMLEFYRVECTKRGIKEDDVEATLDVLRREPALESYLIYDTRQLEDAAKYLLRDLETAESNIRKLEFDLNVQKRDLARFEKQESHKYQEKQEELEAIHAKCQTLERRLSKDFAGFLASISNGRSKPVSGEETVYHSEVAKYLGTKLGTVRHLNDEYVVRLVDLHKGEITTEKGKVIRLSDMGTGQSQSAYLKSLLETDDKRKIIALFDEVATMDGQSLDLVCDRLRKLHNSGRLLVGMIARIGDSVKVVPLDTAGAR